MELEEFPFSAQISEAARDRNTVRLRYKDEDRTVEPYSYRESPSGTGTLLYGFHVEAGSIKAFSLAKIQSVEVLPDTTFSERWPVEIA